MASPSETSNAPPPAAFSGAVAFLPALIVLYLLSPVPVVVLIEQLHLPFQGPVDAIVDLFYAPINWACDWFPVVGAFYQVYADAFVELLDTGRVDAALRVIHG